MKLSEEIQERGFFEAITNPEIWNLLDNQKISFYVGFDPSGDSFHLGQLAVFQLMSLLQKHGHKPILVIGGSTGRIGDPSGKNTERVLLSKEQIRSNINKLLLQMKKSLNFSGENKAIILNNYDWMKDFLYLDFLRDIGKFFPIASIMSKESVKTRIQGTGITYTEFSYLLLQAYDFYFLFKNYNCSLQLGGSDQWGNIVAGIDFIRRQLGRQAYGLTIPLVTKSDGVKFGKSEGGAIWLDKKKTSSFQFYQYFIRTSDEDIIRFLKLFSNFSLKKITEIEKKHQKIPQLRIAQQALAEDLLAYWHHKDEVEKMQKANQILYGGDLKNIKEEKLAEIFDDVPHLQIKETKISNGCDLVSLLVEVGAIASKKKAKQLISAGGIYVNNLQIKDSELKITFKHLFARKFILLRRGKKNYYLLKMLK